jgi:hypothetical protein
MLTHDVPLLLWKLQRGQLTSAFCGHRVVAAIRCSALILIQASSAALCSGKVAVLQNFPLKEEACDEILHPPT